MSLAKKTRHEHIVTINSKVGRNINRAVILNSIRTGQPISRVSIAELTKLNKSTVSSIVNGLLSEDLILEENRRASGVGRRPINLRIKTGKHFVGAISIDSAKTLVAIVDVDGSLKFTEETGTDVHEPIEFVANCLLALESHRRLLHLPRLKGIGISVAGIVDPVRTKVLYAPNLGWEDLDFGYVLHRHSPGAGSISIENDAKASTLAELWFGKYELQPANLVYLAVGRGIGTGIVIDNRIVAGNSHAAGEFGHMIIVEGGEPCSCGNQGCWEAYASDRATARRYAAAKGLPPDADLSINLPDIIALASQGDDAARQALRSAAHYLGLGIANIIRTFDPEAIIIGGAITRAWGLIYPGMMQTVNTTGFFRKQRATRILPTSLTASPALLGAAALSFRRIFTDFRIAI